MINNITVRFFCYGYNDTNQMALLEIDEATFLRLGGEGTYERHTVFANGCDQICLTSDTFME
jgi:hypothetical protein